MTRKPSGPTGRMEMEKGPTGTHDTQAIGSHRGPTGQMEKGPIGTCRMEKGLSGDFYDEKGPSGHFYDELPMSWMSNCRSHMYTSDGERTVWRFMMKCRSLQIKYCSS